MLNLLDKKVTILGAQRSGVALAKLVVRLKGKAKISDQGPENSYTQELQEWLLQHEMSTTEESTFSLDMEFDGHTQRFIENSNIIVVSPAVRQDAQVFKWAKEKNIPVLGEIEFAYQFCTKPIIAVTGSNGKTTVATLVHELLTKAGYQSCLCGNIGVPFSEHVLDLRTKDFVVLELSSFQLESLLEPKSPFRTKGQNGSFCLKGFRPHIAIFLNFSQNHLDRHKDLNEYFAAKTKIFMNQKKEDFAVLNYKDIDIRNLAKKIESQAIYFDRNQRELSAAQSNPNYSAVLQVGSLLGINKELCRDVIKHFLGVEHRLEWVRNLKGVDFINDSKATTAEASDWALKCVQKPIVLICGGRDKNMDFSVLKNQMREKVKKIIVIGEAREKIQKTFQGIIPIELCESLETAVLKARENASEGDCVILSPMCASFDMFANFEERGKVYKDIVHKLT